MRIEAKTDGWWITRTPAGVEEMGPYASRRQAREDRDGVARFLRLIAGRDRRKKRPTKSFPRDRQLLTSL